MRRAKIAEIVGQGHLDWGVADGVLTITGEQGSLSIAWPAPAPKYDGGSWQPVVLERHPDGTALALWQWFEEVPDGDSVHQAAQQAAE